MIRSHNIDKDEAEKMLTEDEPDIKLHFDEKLRKHTWRYFPKKDWTEPPEMEELVNFRDGFVEPEVEPEKSPEVEPEIHDSDDSSSENDEEPPPIICKPSKTKSILKPGPSGLGRKRKRN